MLICSAASPALAQAHRIRPRDLAGEALITYPSRPTDRLSERVRNLFGDRVGVQSGCVDASDAPHGL